MKRRICPKCRSSDVSPDFMPGDFHTGMFNQRFKCNKCGFRGGVFPEEG